jgi:putative phosphoesterase
MKIGVISDTHNFFDPKLPALLNGVEHILHAGDIGQPRLLWELERIAPVTAVLGNTDEPGFHYRPTEVVTLGEFKFLVHHIVNPDQLPEGIGDRIAREQPDVVVFGHTHRPFSRQIGQTLFFNPGYAGHQRFALPRTLGVLHCSKDHIRAEHLAL